MSFDKYKDTDITNMEKLERWGYDSNVYYCGSKPLQKILTHIAKVLRKKYGVTLPFNPACFVHDILYGEISISDVSLWKKFCMKFEADRNFKRDMSKLLKRLQIDNKITKSQYKRLKIRMELFYYIVVLFTPFYLLRHYLTPLFNYLSKKLSNLSKKKGKN